MPLRGLALAAVLLAAGGALAADAKVVRTEPVGEGVRHVLIEHPNGATHTEYQVCIEGVGWFAAERDLVVGSYVLTFGGRRQLAEARKLISEGKREPEGC